MNAELKEKTLSGIAWNFLERFLSRGFNVIITLLLAWFLSPEDYALIAMVIVFVALSQVIVDGGFGHALIRKKNTTREDYNTVFYTNIFLSIFIYSLLYFCAPFIANFYGEQTLVSIIRVVGVSVFFNALTVVQQSVLQKKMLFKLQLKVQLPAVVISSCTALILAYFSFGVWALISQIVVNAFFVALLYWRLNIWRPRRIFSIQSLQELFSFSSFLMMESLLAVPFKNMYNIILPKFFASSIVGIYFFAEKIKELVLSQLVQSIQTVVYPALATLQDEKNRLKDGFRQVVLIMSFVLTAFLLFLSALTESVFGALFPIRWYEAIPFVQILCIAALFYPLNALNLNIMKVVGKTNLILYVGLYKKILGIIIFSITLLFNDIIVVLYGQIIFSILGYIPNSYYASRLIGYSVYEQLLDFLPSLTLSSIVAIFVYFLQSILDFNPLIELLTLSGIAIIVYLILAYLFKLKAYMLTKDLLIKKLKKK